MPNINTCDIHAKHHYFKDEIANRVFGDVNCKARCDASNSKDLHISRKMVADINAKHYYLKYESAPNSF